MMTRQAVSHTVLLEPNEELRGKTIRIILEHSKKNDMYKIFLT